MQYLKQQFDGMIRKVLTEKGKKVEVSPELYKKIKAEINKNDTGRSIIMKSNMFKKVAVLAAVLCLGTATVFAASKINSYVSISNITDSAFPTKNHIKAELGYSVKTVKEFSNGFKFNKYSISNDTALDAENKIVGEFKELTLYYTLKKTDNKNPLSLSISKPLTNDDNSASDIKMEINNTEFTYSETQYKFVPEGYKLTKEDQEKLDAGKIEISEGSDQVEEVKYQFLSWMEDGISYCIMAPGYQLSQEEMVKMAEEVIQ